MPEVLEGWVTTGDAMRISGYGRARLYQLREEKKITSMKVGRTVLYRKEEMEQLNRDKKERREDE